MQHIENLKRHIDQGTLVRNQWRGTDAQGRETACLLAAMVPQCGIDGSSASCPAEIMPSWLARLTPYLDDRGSLAAWPGMVCRYAGLAAQWYQLDAATWQRVQYRFLASIVTEARSQTTSVSVHEVCDMVIALCNRVVETGAIDVGAFSRATWAARAAGAAAAAAAARAAGAEAAGAAAAEAAAWDRITVSLFEAIELELKARDEMPGGGS